MAGESMPGSPEKPLCEAVKVRLYCFGDVGDARDLRYICPGEQQTGCGISPRECCCQQSQNSTPEKLFDIRHGVTGFGLGLIQYFFTLINLLPFSNLYSVIMYAGNI